MAKRDIKICPNCHFKNQEATLDLLDEILTNSRRNDYE